MNYQEITQHAYTANVLGREDWATKLKAEVDARNVVILAQRQADLDKRVGMSEGDIILFPNDKIARVSHDWGKEVQTTDGQFGASFYLSTDGYVSFSGGLDPCIPKTEFEFTGETKPASVWFFSENRSEAHNGWHCQANFKVWKFIGDPTKYYQTREPDTTKQSHCCS